MVKLLLMFALAMTTFVVVQQDSTIRRQHAVIREMMTNPACMVTPMHTDLFTFADSVVGAEHAFNTTLSLRRAGYKTRLAPRVMEGTTTRVLTVMATPAPRPSRKERGLDKYLR